MRNEAKRRPGALWAAMVVMGLFVATGAVVAPVEPGVRAALAAAGLTLLGGASMLALSRPRRG